MSGHYARPGPQPRRTIHPVIWSAAAIILLTFAAVSMHAQVHLIIKNDGTKVISNFGSPASKHGSDWNWWAKQRDRRSSFDDVVGNAASEGNLNAVKAQLRGQRNGFRFRPEF